MAGTLFVVATPIGNLEDISPRALRVLKEVALIAAEDTRRTAHLLQRFGLTTRTTSFHEHSPKEKASDLVRQLLSGDDIALVSDAGTPLVSDPGEHLVALAHQAGVKVEPIPGPSALAAALSASGFGSDGFLFLGFPPTRGALRRAWFDRLAAARELVSAGVFYEAPHRITATLADLADRLGDVRVCVCRELTKAHEEVRRGRLSEIVLSSDRGEFTVVVDLGETTEKTNDRPLGPTEAAHEFGELTKSRAMSRRQAIASLSRRYGVSAREVYSMLETAKKSVV